MGRQNNTAAIKCYPTSCFSFLQSATYRKPKKVTPSAEVASSDTGLNPSEGAINATEGPINPLEGAVNTPERDINPPEGAVNSPANSVEDGSTQSNTNKVCLSYTAFSIYKCFVRKIF